MIPRSKSGLAAVATELTTMRRRKAASCQR